MVETSEKVSQISEEYVERDVYVTMNCEIDLSANFLKKFIDSDGAS